ncbi:MAG: glycosyltransferase [Desulfatitalea sp.]|nr:glycosyltransferase [Desulfatitalea sp.]
MYRSKTIDVIIVNYNSTDYAIRSIDSIKRDAKDVFLNLVVFDNGSVDSPERILDFHPETNLILNEVNVGYSKAINYSLKTCDSPYVLIMNPDTFVEHGFINHAIEHLENNHRVGIIGPKILEIDGRVQGSARRYPSFWTTIFGRKSPLTTFFPNNPITKKEFFCFNVNGSDTYEVDWVSGACMVMRREAIERINGFDEDYFLYWEDADLCKRLNSVGWKTVYDTKAVITHLVGKSSNTKPIQSICHFHHSSYKYFMKHTKNFVKLFTPVVILGLGLRCLIVLLSNIINRKFNDTLLSLIVDQIRNSKFKSPNKATVKHNENTCTSMSFCVSNPRRLLILNQYFPPDRSATAGILERISGMLSEKHRVIIISGRPSYQPTDRQKWRLLSIRKNKNITILRVGSSAYPRHAIHKRIFNYVTYLSLSLPISFLLSFDMIIAFTDPPIIGLVGVITSKIRRKPLIYYIQDFHPDMAIAAGMIKDGFITHIWKRIHSIVLRSADRLIVIGDDMKERVVHKGISPEKVQVIRHGALLSKSENDIDQALIDKIRGSYALTLIYAGNVGTYGVWENLIRAIIMLDNENIGLVFVGEGQCKLAIEKMCSGVKNVSFYPYQKKEKLKSVLRAGDVHIISIKKNMEGLVVPSKIYPILSAGKPILGVCPESSDTARIIRKYNCGLIADPDNVESIANAIKELFDNRADLVKYSRNSLRAAKDFNQSEMLEELSNVIHGCFLEQ